VVQAAWIAISRLSRARRGERHAAAMQADMDNAFALTAASSIFQ
jgi:hypothetical protein